MVVWSFDLSIYNSLLPHFVSNASDSSFSNSPRHLFSHRFIVSFPVKGYENKIIIVHVGPELTLLAQNLESRKPRSNNGRTAAEDIQLAFSLSNIWYLQVRKTP